MKRKNIIVLLLDTARAAEAYDYRIMPSVSYLARKASSYRNAIAPGTWTAPAHASLFIASKVSSISQASKDFFTGKPSIDPWLVRLKFLPDDADTLACKLSRLGYFSTLFSNNPFITSFTNMAIGFDKVYDLWMDSNIKYNKSIVEKVSFIINGGASAREKMYRVSSLVSRLMPRRTLDSVYLGLRSRLTRRVAATDGTYRLDRGASDAVKAVRRYLARDYNFRPQFMFLNYIEAHENYPVSREVVQDKWLYLSGIEDLGRSTAEKLHSAYVRRLHYLDGMVSKTISALKAGGVLDNATVIVTSDHGQLFGEHGLLYHALPPYEGLARVPLVAANYDNGRLVRTYDAVEDTASLTSLHQAILDIASGKERYLDGNIRAQPYVLSEHTGICEGWDEQLLRNLKGRSSYAKRIYESKSRWNIRSTAVYHGSMKLMHFFGARKDELYDLSKDPTELNNIICSNRHLAHALARHAS